MRTVSILLNANIPDEITSGKKSHNTTVKLTNSFRRWIKSNCISSFCSLLTSVISQDLHIFQLPQNFQRRNHLLVLTEFAYDIIKKKF